MTFWGIISDLFVLAAPLIMIFICFVLWNKPKWDAEAEAQAERDLDEFVQKHWHL